ncbi:MAG TPA: DUF1080 domain-containing protein [Cyclobacteriaceae bacterium]|nr:DUF1080 domain-containing protein [Cyclobacteriaceae bacterium]
MKYFVPFVLILIWSCQTKPKNDAIQESSTAATLTPDQVAEGWRLLFDGQSLVGWRTYQNQPSNSWRVEDGTLHCMPFDSAEQRADLVTIDQYENFELQFDWKIGYQGNSGVMFRVSEEFDQPYLTGPEYQLLDDVGYPGESKDANKTGANFDMQAPEARTAKPQGEWNTSRLLVNGNHVEHWLNGIKVLSYDLGSEEWLQQKANCKWKDVDSYGSNSIGHIDLQDHSMEAWFRNIMIRTL